MFHHPSRSRRARGYDPAMAISVVIPALNAAAELPATLAGLEEGRAAGLVAEVVVIDGGSTDGTADRAAAAGCRVLRTASGRGRQLAAGGAAAAAAWLLFLHADTRLAAGWTRAVGSHMAGPDAAASLAGHFRFALDDASAAARRLERAVAWRSRRLALPYGDQGLLIGRTLYRDIGGFRPLPLMEDVDIVRRIGRRRLVALDATAVTSAVRWRRDGYVRRSARNLCCLGLYYAGLPPRFIQALYR